MLKNNKKPWLKNCKFLPLYYLTKKAGMGLENDIIIDYFANCPYEEDIKKLKLSILSVSTVIVLE